MLLTSLLRCYLPLEDVYVVAVTWKGTGHCWTVANWKVIESTRNSQRMVNEAEYSPDVFFNDEYCYAKSSDFDFVLVGERYCFMEVNDGNT